MFHQPIKKINKISLISNESTQINLNPGIAILESRDIFNILTGVDIRNRTSAFDPRSLSDTTTVKITVPTLVSYGKNINMIILWINGSIKEVKLIIVFHNLLAVFV